MLCLSSFELYSHWVSLLNKSQTKESTVRAECYKFESMDIFELHDPENYS